MNIQSGRDEPYYPKKMSKVQITCTSSPRLIHASVGIIRRRGKQVVIYTTDMKFIHIYFLTVPNDPIHIYS